MFTPVSKPPLSPAVVLSGVTLTSAGTTQPYLCPKRPPIFYVVHYLPIGPQSKLVHYIVKRDAASMSWL